jgi:hypothetical protein
MKVTPIRPYQPLKNPSFAAYMSKQHSAYLTKMNKSIGGNKRIGGYF